MASTFGMHLMNGFDLLYERTEEVLKSTTEMGTYFKNLAAVESEYAKSLSKLNQATKKLFGTRTKKTAAEVGQLKSCWDSIQGELEGIANTHSTLSGNILNDVAQQIAAHVKQKEQERKRLVDEGKRITKEYKDVLAAHKAAQGTYERKCKEAEKAHVTHENAKNAPNTKPKDLHKLNSTAQKCVEAAAAADGEYQKMIQKANAKQRTFHESEMPNLLKSFQEFEEDRIRFLKSIFAKFHSLLADFPQSLQTTEQSINRAITAIAVDEDIKVYAEANKTNFVVPPDIRYEPFVPESPSFAACFQSTPPPNLSSSSSSSAPSLSAQSSSGAIPASKAKATSSFSPGAAKADPANREWGLSDADRSLSNDEKIRKLKDQLNEVNNNIRAEDKSKKGLEKLVKFYTSDPAAQEKTREELTEQNRKLGLLREGRNKIKGQLGELGEYVPPDNDDDEDGGGYQAAPPPPPPAGVCRVRGLYDYSATNDTELSFGEGDILNITERDDSGWWYAELNGTNGFIPSNYVEVLD